MANNTNKAPRITKAQRFEDIISMLNGESVAHGTTVEIATEVINHELELLAKKNSSESKKVTEAQAANETYMTMISEYLGGLAPDSIGKTCNEINKEIIALNEFSNQKIAFLMRKLKERGIVRATESKGKSYFSLA